jgi:hypothetical protein
MRSSCNYPQLKSQDGNSHRPPLSWPLPTNIFPPFDKARNPACGYPQVSLGWRNCPVPETSTPKTMSGLIGDGWRHPLPIPRPCSACLAHSEVDLSLDCPHCLLLARPAKDQGQIRMQRSESGSRAPGMVPVSAKMHPCTWIDCTEPYGPRTRRRRVLMTASVDDSRHGSSLGGLVLRRGWVTHERPENSEGLLATMSEGTPRLRLWAASATFRYQPGRNCRQALSRQFRPAIQLVF